MRLTFLFSFCSSFAFISSIFENFPFFRFFSHRFSCFRCFEENTRNKCKHVHYIFIFNEYKYLRIWVYVCVSILVFKTEHNCKYKFSPVVLFSNKPNYLKNLFWVCLVLLFLFFFCYTCSSQKATVHSGGHTQIPIALLIAFVKLKSFHWEKYIPMHFIGNKKEKYILMIITTMLLLIHVSVSR